MVKPEYSCDSNGQCWYVYTDPWHRWGRWLMLGALVLFFILLIVGATYGMSRRRMQTGEAPIAGTAWMFPSLYREQDSYPTMPASQREHPWGEKTRYYIRDSLPQPPAAYKV